MDARRAEFVWYVLSFSSCSISVIFFMKFYSLFIEPKTEEDNSLRLSYVSRLTTYRRALYICWGIIIPHSGITRVGVGNEYSEYTLGRECMFGRELPRSRGYMVGRE
jgi:hypothetical protein